MFLALREMRRAVVRFALLAASVGLLVFLILFQQTLQAGLITSFIGAIEHQSSPVLVYSVDGLRNLEGSVITPELEQQIRAVDGVGAAGRIGQGTFSVTADGDVTSAAVIGYEDERLGAPTTLTVGRLPSNADEVVALDSAADEGFGLGDSVTVEPGGLELDGRGPGVRDRPPSRADALHDVRDVRAGRDGRESRRRRRAPRGHRRRSC